ncbi:MAG: M48 family metalloprotease [Chloroflexi bacterium]|nr:M48 family metalloprotease [Chloroflexota bacterium]MDA1241093.1 M48 family metalloprotease [Chloroflexota bacterium]
MNNLKTVVLLAAISGLLVAVGGAMGGASGALLFLFIAAAMNFGSYWFSADIVLRGARAREIQRDQDPALFDMVAEVAGRAEMPMPRVYVMDSMQPNAFATGRSPKHAAVAVTTGIRQMLSERELRAVMGHELAHVKNRDILTSSVVATIASAISALAWMGMFFGGRNNNGAGNLLAVIIAPIAATLIQLGISRSREFQADADGARIVDDPEGLAAALQKIEMGARRVPMAVSNSTAHLFIINPFAALKGAQLMSTHPPTEERVARLARMNRTR